MKKTFIAVVIFTISALCSSGAETKGWYLQSVIPEKAKDKVKVSAEFRYRLEARNNFDFDDAKDDKDVFHLFRTRLNIEMDPVSFARGFAQFQDARIASSEFSNHAPFEDHIDLRQGFIELYDPAKKGVGAKVGRQELIYGSERLIGAFNWSNVAQSFDAIKLFYQWDLSRVDVFAARRVLINPTVTFDEWDSEDNLIGFYSTCQAVKDHTMDLYCFFRDTDKPIAFGKPVGSGDLSESTIGARIAGKKTCGVDYQVETAYQFGDFGSQDISAWMFIGIMGYTFDVTWKPRVAFEFDHASGDEDSKDNERNTFDNLFPTNHMYYGYMDLASLQNINDFVATASVKPLNKLTMKVDTHFLFLDETSDALYNAGRIATRTAEVSGVANQLGTELDLTINYQICSQSSVLIGYSHFFAGNFLSDTGAANDGDFFYLQLTANF